MSKETITTQKTIRVRIAVAVCPDGKYSAFGFSGHTDDEMKDAVFIDDLPLEETFHWVEADVPLPVSQTIEGEVQ